MRTLLEKRFVNKPHKSGRVVRWACKLTYHLRCTRLCGETALVSNSHCEQWVSGVGKLQGISQLGLGPLDTRVIKNGLLIAEPISPKLKDGGDIPHILLLYETHVTLSCLHHCLTFLFLILKL